MTRRVDMGEAMDSPTHVGHLEKRALSEVATSFALNGPAKVVRDGHGKINNLGHGGEKVGRSRLTGERLLIFAHGHDEH